MRRRLAEHEEEVLHRPAPEARIQPRAQRGLEEVELLHPRRVVDVDDEHAASQPPRAGVRGKQRPEDVLPVAPHGIVGEIPSARKPGERRGEHLAESRRLTAHDAVHWPLLRFP